MDEIATDYYEALFGKIKEVSENHTISLADVMMNVLNLNKSSAYKRIQGKYQLSVNEILQLTSYYKISVDNFLGYRFRPLPFFADAIIKKPSLFDHYFKNILKHMIAIKQGSHLNVFYLASEIPLFHLIQFMPLVYFKLYMWNKINWKSIPCNDVFSIQDFEGDLELQKSAKALADIYYSFNDIEIWNTRMLNTTFDQIRYMISCSLFKSREDVLIIIEQLQQLLKHLEDIANEGVKRISKENEVVVSRSQIYMNEVSSGQEVILTHSDKGYLVFNTYDHPNYFHTSDMEVGIYIQKWLESIVEHSTPISKDNSKDRLYLFKSMTKHFEISVKEVKGLLDYMY